MYTYATVYKVVLTDYGLAGSGNLDVQLETLYGKLHSFCKTNHIPLHMETLTKHLLAFPRMTEYPVGILVYICTSFTLVDF